MSKKLKLEKWVTKEKEDLNITKKVFEQQWKKTAILIEHTQKYSDKMKKILNASLRKKKSDNDLSANRPHTASLMSDSGRSDSGLFANATMDFVHSTDDMPPYIKRRVDSRSKSGSSMNDTEMLTESGEIVGEQDIDDLFK
jgi:hypothetical protein